MLVNFQGGKEYTDPGQLKEDFFSLCTVWSALDFIIENHACL